MNIQNEALVRGDRRAVKTILAIALLGLTMSQASAQTTNPFLNGLLDRANGEVRGAQQDMAAIEGKTQDLRYACWNGDDRACNGLRRILRNPNLDTMGSLVQRPTGAYWPFDPWGRPQASGQW